MVKSYLRYQQTACFGVINSVQCPVIYDWIGKHAITAGLDAVLAWNLRQGSCVGYLHFALLINYTNHIYRSVQW